METDSLEMTHDSDVRCVAAVVTGTCCQCCSGVSGDWPGCWVELDLLDQLVPVQLQLLPGRGRLGEDSTGQVEVVQVETVMDRNSLGQVPVMATGHC